MKLKLKYKLPFIFLGLVIVLLILISIYVRTEISNKILRDVGKYKEQMEVGNDAIVSEVEKRIGNPKEIKKYIDETTSKSGVAFTLYKEDFEHVVYNTESKKDAHFSYVYSVKDKNSGTVYFLKIGKYFSIKQFKDQFVFTNFFFSNAFVLLAIVLLTIFLALTFYFTLNITKPIEHLNRRLSQISLARPLKPLSYKRNDEIGELYDNVHMMEKRIYDAQTEEVNMIAAIAHDLKTPLTTINGFLELMRSHPELTESQKEEYLALIQKKAESMTDIVQDFSNFTHHEMQLQELNVQSVCVKSFFENIAEEYEAELSGLDFELKWSHSFIEEYIEINEGMMRRVFANMFSNAVRYSQQDHLLVVMNGYVKKDKVIITIEDNGVGVPKEDLHNIFKKFYTVDHSRQRYYGGTGLGLSSCKSIIERKNGNIYSFTSQYGGLGIEIELPILNKKIG